MRKKRKQWKQNRKYFFLWIGLVFLFFLSFLFPIDPSYRRPFQNLFVYFREFSSPKKVTLSNYLDKELALLKEENEQLRHLLSYKESLSSFTVLPAQVLSRGTRWEEVLTIDIGKKEGVEVGMAVVSEVGLVGRISEVFSSSSTVQLLTRPLDTNKVAVSISFENGTVPGILQGYDSASGNLLVALIHPGEVPVGSSVFTNGLGSLFPQDIPVGTVREVSTDALGIATVLSVSPSVDFDSLGYLFVLAK